MVLYPEHTGDRSFQVTDWRKRWPNVATLNEHFLSMATTQCV